MLIRIHILLDATQTGWEGKNLFLFLNACQHLHCSYMNNTSNGTSKFEQWCGKLKNT